MENRALKECLAERNETIQKMQKKIESQAEQIDKLEHIIKKLTTKGVGFSGENQTCKEPEKEEPKKKEPEENDFEKTEWYKNHKDDYFDDQYREPRVEYERPYRESDYGSETEETEEEDSSEEGDPFGLRRKPKKVNDSEEENRKEAFQDKYTKRLGGKKDCREDHSVEKRDGDEIAEEKKNKSIFNFYTYRQPRPQSGQQDSTVTTNDKETKGNVEGSSNDNPHCTDSFGGKIWRGPQDNRPIVKNVKSPGEENFKEEKPKSIFNFYTYGKERPQEDYSPTEELSYEERIAKCGPFAAIPVEVFMKLKREAKQAAASAAPVEKEPEEKKPIEAPICKVTKQPIRFKFSTEERMTPPDKKAYYALRPIRQKPTEYDWKEIQKKEKVTVTEKQKDDKKMVKKETAKEEKVYDWGGPPTGEKLPWHV